MEKLKSYNNKIIVINYRRMKPRSPCPPLPGRPPTSPSGCWCRPTSSSAQVPGPPILSSWNQQVRWSPEVLLVRSSLDREHSLEICTFKRTIAPSFLIVKQQVQYISANTRKHMVFFIIKSLDTSLFWIGSMLYNIIFIL